jgi:hypothetical protein
MRWRITVRSPTGDKDFGVFNGPFGHKEALKNAYGTHGLPPTADVSITACPCVVQLTFQLDGDVTPDVFAQQVATACARGGAMRLGESILLPSDPEKAIVAADLTRDKPV